MGDKVREEFEAWAVLQLGGSFRRYDDGFYRDDDIENSWLGWEASRSSLVIELPPKGLSADPGLPGNAWHNTRSNTIEACRRAIESVGVRVKP